MLHKPAALALLFPVFLATSACNGPAPASAGHTAAAVADTLIDPASGASCSGKNLHLTRSDADWVINGECADVTISASNVSANIEKARSILNQNVEAVTVKGSNVTVNVIGERNTLNLTEIGQVQVEGNHNMVLGRSAGKVSFTGHDNAINVDNEPELDDRGTGNRVI